MKRLLADLPSGQVVFYRFTAQDLDDVSEPLVGRFRTAPADRRSIRFVWSGDTAGQAMNAVVHPSSSGMTTRWSTTGRHRRT